MYLAQKHLNRRTALKGLGATVALPFLEAMVPARTALAKTAAAPRVRLAAFEMVHGSAGATVVGLQKNMWSPAAKASIALATVEMPWGRPGDELYAEIFYQKELKWSRVMARCRVVEGAFFDPPRRRLTPAADR